MTSSGLGTDTGGGGGGRVKIFFGTSGLSSNEGPPVSTCRNPTSSSPASSSAPDEPAVELLGEVCVFFDLDL